MSALSIGSTGGLPGVGVPPIDPANEPASIRNGNKAAKNAYQTGLAFEQVLVNELTQQLSKTVSGGSGSDGSSTDASGADSSGGSSGASGGMLGSDPASSMYEQMLPQALSSTIMSSGGTGLALQIAKGIDPSIGVKS
jgi:Rod binding domain-containing protein